MLNKDAEAEIERLSKTILTEYGGDDWDDVVDEESAMSAVRAAMIWAYKDAVTICQRLDARAMASQRGADPYELSNVMARQMAVWAGQCANAIEERAKDVA